MNDTIVIAGSLAQKPLSGGHTWVLLQYLLGFRRLGWDVLLLDRLEPGMCVDARGSPCVFQHSLNLRYLLDVMRRFDLAGSFSLSYNGGEQFAGLDRRQVLARVKRCALFLNVMGYLADQEILAAAPRRVFLDIDPGFGQMWHALGLSDLFRNHDAHVTIAENIGQPDCEIPTVGIEWITTRPPVVLEHWQAQNHAGAGSFTSIASWRGAYAPVEYRGKRYGLRAHEFRRFAPLPLRTRRSFELALDIHHDEDGDVELLQVNGWTLVDPRVAAGDPWQYRTYIQNSKAEFMVAKNMYVEAHSGWFSDRSCCYLASGRPVLAQDTGLDGIFPTGAGLLTFRTLEEACAGVQALSRDYPFHARAARALAQEYFDSDRVLKRLGAKLGIA